MLKNLIGNPFHIIAFSFSLSYMLYLLPFSDKYLPLNLINALPGLYFIFLNFMSGLVWSRFNLNLITSFSTYDILRVRRRVDILGYVVLSLIGIELVIYGIPLFGQVSYTDFGAPIIHVALVSCLLILSIISSFTYKVNSKWIFLSLIIGFLILNRFLILFVCIGGLLTYLSLNKIKINTFLKVTFFLFIVISVFGALGTWRMANIMDVSYIKAQDYILSAGHASDYYKEIGLPTSVFWFWIYITSPISNFILNVELNNMAEMKNISNVILFELLPQTISKRLGDYPIEVLLLSENLNVSSSITPSYISLGYLGITIYFSYYCFLFFFVTTLFRGLRRKVVVILLSTLSSFMIFFNIIIMPIFIFSVSVLFLFSLRFRKCQI
jgi:hypothetical protein